MHRCMSMRHAEPDRDLSDRELVRALKALADPTRFRMIQEIAQAGELSCGEVTERFDVSQPTISHHLKILVDAGLLVQRAAGKQHYTSVDRARLHDLVATLPKRLRAAPSKKPRPVARARATGRRRAASNA
jgi:ArsR family transcriptional regulator, arsenate/arsenite/antimonite-responsive transcriptional repressor